MASLSTHYQECIEKLGKPFKEVNDWLDEFAGQKTDHHQHRHHAEGIIEAGLIFGPGAGRAAELHVLKDLAAIPKNREDYLNGDFTKWPMLLSHYDKTKNLWK